MARNLLMDLIYFLFEQESSLDFLLLRCLCGEYSEVETSRCLETGTRFEVASKAFDIRGSLRRQEMTFWTKGYLGKQKFEKAAMLL